jgi:hypothetical protein
MVKSREKISPPLIFYYILDMNLYLMGSELFLVGCIFLMIDSLLAVRKKISFRSLVYLLGCVFFTAGCVVFVIDGLHQTI